MPDKLPPQLLSNLLWAANGVNRPASSKRTAPSSHNSQEIDIYLATGQASYLYDATSQRLIPVAQGDHRDAVAGSLQQEMAEAPVSLIIVADLGKLGDGSGSERDIRTAHIDAGMVSQNINLFCAAAGLATVTRSSMDRETLAKVLKLTPMQIAILNNPVGMPKR